MKKITSVIIECPACHKPRKLVKSSFRPKAIKKLCLSCAALKRSSDPNYIQRMSDALKGRIGKRGEHNPSWGKKYSEERKQKIKLTKYRVLPDGRTVAQAAAEKTAVTMRLMGYNERTEKAAATKEKNKSWVVYKTREFNGLKYRSKAELDFITKHKDIRNCDCSFIYYINGKKHRYIPDFIDANNDYYEIKSDWTWNNKIEGSNLQLVNEAKLMSVVDAGYNITLVLYIGKDIVTRLYKGKMCGN